MKEEDDIAELFASELANLSFTPDASVKERIDNAIQQKKKKKRIIWWFFVIGGISIASMIMYAVVNKHFEKTTSASTSVAAIQTNVQHNEDTHSTNAKLEKKTKVTIKSQQILTSKPNLNKKELTLTGKEFIAVRKINSFIPKGKKGIKQSKTVVDNQQIDIHASQSTSQTEQSESTEQPLNALTLNSKQGDQPKASVNEKLTDTLSIKDSITVVESNETFNSFQNILQAQENKLKSWYIGITHGWDFESMKPFAYLDSNEIYDHNFHQYRVKATHVTHKLECWKQLSNHFTVLFGLGYRYTNFTIKDREYIWTIYQIENLTASSPEFITELNSLTRTSKGSFGSIIIPLGFQYNVRLAKSPFNFAFAAGVDLQFKMHQKAATMNIRTFGMNAWMQPAIYHDINRFRISVFGRLNIPIAQQLHINANKMSIQRGQLFGAGIGLYYKL